MAEQPKKKSKDELLEEFSGLLIRSGREVEALLAEKEKLAEELKLKMNDLSSMLTDLQARLHKVDMVAKSYKIENDFVKRNMNALMKNLVMLLLKSKSLNLQQLSKFTGINEKELEPFLETLIKDNKIKKEEDIYSLA